jgi:cysteine-rich repeat protein
MVLNKAWMAMTALVALGALSACATSNVGTTSTGTSTGTNTGGDTGSGGNGTGGDVGTGGDAGNPNVPVCGDGTIATSEVCDDGNTAEGDGCSATCDFESGWECSGEPTKCTAICGDGKVLGKEECDDGNVENGDGCTNACTLALGWTCSGEPSACITPCGDGIIAGKEECDDTNAVAGDGCSDMCAVEPGFTCVMVPSKCASVCGDGIIASDEACDDHNFMPGDGCSDACVIEQYWSCDGAPSVCTTPCGDGLIVGTEVCDDGNTMMGDGCSDICSLEPGYACNGEPSACATVCGDGIVAGMELCDDGNATSGDGCNVFCKKEPGWVCNNAMPSFCNTVCGDGYPAGPETCDDGNLNAGDGCSSTCLAEHGYLCFNIPSVCSTVCGDGVIGGAEQCDDGNSNSADGCSATCVSEVGFTCMGEPSTCDGICGDGIVIGSEGCDDGNLTDGDCCSATCGAENGCEIELNDETLSANDYAAIAINGVLKGFVKPGTDVDYYVFSINVPANATGAITAATLDGFVASSCANNTLDSAINIYDQNANPLANDNDSGPGLCSVATAAGLQTGDYFIEVKSGKAAGPTPFDYTLQIQGQIVVCGDGNKGPGEECDDANLTNGDGCNDTCHIEVANEIEPNDTVAQATANGPFATNMLWAGGIGPVGSDSDYFMITLPTTVDLKIETFDGTGPNNCAAIDTLIAFFAPNGTTQLASDDDDGVNACSIVNPATATDAGMRHLLPGNYFVRIKSFSSVIPAYRVLLTFTAICGNGIKEGYEECDGPNGPACDANCNIIPVCGDGIVKVPETCDDGNLNDADGCSSTCAPEPNYICVGQPSVCTLHENVCNDGMDNDNDNLVDCFDPDCQGQAICVILPCDAGQTQHIYNSTDTPKAISDNTTMTSIINVPDVATINRVIVKLNITHTWDSDLDIGLISPTAMNIDLSSDNGGSADNYTNTVFDQNCMNSVINGVAPFDGCFKPEGMLPSLIGQASNGNWTLSVGDDAGGDQGTLQSWNLILCTTP